MATQNEQYEVGRQFAAEILNVSVRTLDRYTKKKQISSVRRGRQLFFNEEDLLNFKGQLMAKEMGKQRAAAKKKTPPTMSSFKAARNDDFIEVQRAQIKEQGNGETQETVVDAAEHLEQKLYKKLYEESEDDNRNLRKQVEGANYRLGQLETQVANMIPMIEYKKQKDELLLLAEENQFKLQDIKTLETSLKIEQFAKKIYAGLLWGMLCLIPILLILRMLT
ncbi:MAG: helix-turn-helix domain-containing protein [Candidatus Gracilibacteria bacterium]|nr:helix-turn-helix domain-containing protein [Candidatus Gracilibacteria bacterium]